MKNNFSVGSVKMTETIRQREHPKVEGGQCNQSRRPEPHSRLSVSVNDWGVVEIERHTE
jgi:hypothetical protein